MISTVSRKPAASINSADELTYLEEITCSDDGRRNFLFSLHDKALYKGRHKPTF